MELLKDRPPKPSYELVLVVDDNPDFVLSMNLLLTSLGYRVGTVSTGEEAIDYLNRFPVDIVLTDLYMPGMDGIEMMRRLRKRDGQSIIVVTGDTHLAMETNTTAAKMLGAHALLIKPFSKDQLAQAIAQAKSVARPSSKAS